MYVNNFNDLNQLAEKYTISHHEILIEKIHQAILIFGCTLDVFILPHFYWWTMVYIAVSDNLIILIIISLSYTL